MPVSSSNCGMRSARARWSFSSPVIRRLILVPAYFFHVEVGGEGRHRAEAAERRGEPEHACALHQVAARQPAFEGDISPSCGRSARSFTVISLSPILYVPPTDCIGLGKDCIAEIKSVNRLLNQFWCDNRENSRVAIIRRRRPIGICNGGGDMVEGHCFNPSARGKTTRSDALRLRPGHKDQTSIGEVSR